MNALLDKIVANVPLAVKRPGRALRLASRRMFPFAVLAHDPEAYRCIASWTFGGLRRVPLREVFPGIEVVEVTITRTFDRRPHISPSAGDILALAAIVRYTAPTRILEIGTAQGNTTLNLAANAPPLASVTTVDLPPDREDEMAKGGRRRSTNRLGAAVGRQLGKDPYSAKIHQVLADSAKVDWQVLNPPFDMVFIDGCHAYDVVRRDTENAIAHVNPGGLIIWHDYGIVEDVSRVVDEASRGIRVCPVRSTSLAVGFAP